MKKILILCADHGKLTELSQAIHTTLTSLNSNVSLINLLDLNLPLYTYPTEEKSGIPKELSTLSTACEQANSFVIISPEYNSGIPPVLSNAIAWLSRANDDYRYFFNNKIALMGSYSYTGAANLFSALRTQLASLGLTPIGKTISFTPNHPINTEKLPNICRTLIKLTNA